MILRSAKLSLNKRRTYCVVILEQGNTKMNGLSMATRRSSINWALEKGGFETTKSPFRSHVKKSSSSHTTSCPISRKYWALCPLPLNASHRTLSLGMKRSMSSHTCLGV